MIMRHIHGHIRAAALPALALLLVVVPLLTQGCGSIGNRTLDPSGPYQGDSFLFAVDTVIAEVGDQIALTQSVAARNPLVASRPEVAAVLAKIGRIRDGVVDRKPDGTIADHEILALLIQARDAYADAKTAAAASEVNGRLSLARELLVQVRQLLPLFIAVPSQ